jgi:hypothetical protein
MVRHGGCNCGAVRLTISGNLKRFGLCHCLTCRKETGSAFLPSVIWPSSDVTIDGGTSSWDKRHFCPRCGSRLFHEREGGDEIEVLMGCLDDAPTNLAPDHEIWTARREHWLRSVHGTTQHENDPPWIPKRTT